MLSRCAATSGRRRLGPRASSSRRSCRRACCSAGAIRCWSTARKAFVPTARWTGWPNSDRSRNAHRDDRQCLPAERCDGGLPDRGARRAEGIGPHADRLPAPECTVGMEGFGGSSNQHSTRRLAARAPRNSHLAHSSRAGQISATSTAMVQHRKINWKIKDVDISVNT